MAKKIKNKKIMVTQDGLDNMVAVAIAESDLKYNQACGIVNERNVEILALKGEIGRLERDLSTSTRLTKEALSDRSTWRERASELERLLEEEQNMHEYIKEGFDRLFWYVQALRKKLGY